jgi:lysophospholipase L1-like esterase
MKAIIIKKVGLLFFIGMTFFSCQENSNSNDASMIGKLRGDKVSSRFEQEILNFEESDKIRFPQKNGILFTGSSSIRMWETLEKDMAPLPIINRGFGGSTTPEVIQYIDRIVFPYEPQIIVFYCGENDIHEKTLPQITVQNFKKFVGLVNEKLPDTEIIYLSMKPSIARWDEWDSYRTGNLMIKQFTNSQDKVHYLNVGRTMLVKGEIPDPNIFIEDGLHMNKHGYVRWTSMIKPLLKKLYIPEIQ